MLWLFLLRIKMYIHYIITAESAGENENRSIFGKVTGKSKVSRFLTHETECEKRDSMCVRLDTVPALDRQRGRRRDGRN